jgi:hypothetical protein
METIMSLETEDNTAPVEPDLSREAFEKEANEWWEDGQDGDELPYTLTPFQQAYAAKEFLYQACTVATTACRAGLIPEHKDEIETGDITDIDPSYVHFTVKYWRRDDELIEEHFSMPTWAVYDRHPWFDKLAQEKKEAEAKAQAEAEARRKRSTDAVENKERAELARLRAKYGA